MLLFPPPTPLPICVLSCCPILLCSSQPMPHPCQDRASLRHSSLNRACKGALAIPQRSSPPIAPHMDVSLLTQQRPLATRARRPIRRAKTVTCSAARPEDAQSRRALLSGAAAAGLLGLAKAARADTEAHMPVRLGGCPATASAALCSAAALFGAGGSVAGPPRVRVPHPVAALLASALLPFVLRPALLPYLCAHAAER